MKIDLDLSDIYEDETGAKLKPEFIELVSSALVNSMASETRRVIDDQVNKKLTEMIRDHVENKMEKIFADFLDYEYQEVTSWGEKKEKWSIRNKIASTLKEAVGFERKEFWSTSKETPFTKLIVKAIEENIRPLADEMRQTMNLEFKKACIVEASRQLAERMK